jgi:hypothetical protein
MATIKGRAGIARAGGVVPREPVPRKVVWKHVDRETGEEMNDEIDVFIIRRDFNMAVRIYDEANKDKDRNAILLEVSKSLLIDDEKGGREFAPYDWLASLDETLVLAFFKEVREVNSGPKNSTTPTNSSASSSSTESAETASSSAEPT